MNIISIPNLTVREQLYGYMIDIYKDSSGLNLEVEKLNILMYAEWHTKVIGILTSNISSNA